MQKTWVRSLGQEDTLEKEMATHSNILAGKNGIDLEALVGYSPQGHEESDTTENRGIILMLQKKKKGILVSLKTLFI